MRVVFRVLCVAAAAMISAILAAHTLGQVMAQNAHERVIKVPGGWKLRGSDTVYPFNPLVPADKADPFPAPKQPPAKTPRKKKR